MKTFTFLKSVLVALLLITMSLTSSAYDFMVDSIAYKINADGSVSVTYTQQWSSWNYHGLTTANIPSSVVYNGTTYSVSSIDDYAFSLCYDLTSVNISNSIVTIGSFAFDECYNLTSITIPNSVTSIGEGAFCGCYGIKQITIGRSVSSIGKWAFEGCVYLTSIIVINGNTTYDTRDNCNALIETASNTLILGCMNSFIPNTVTVIGENAFYLCNGLTNITIGSSVVTIGSNAFYGCGALTNIDFPNSVRIIDGSAFEGCGKLTNISLPNTLVTIGKSAFSGCTGLTNIIIPDSVTTIGEDAFKECSELTSVTLGENVSTIGQGAFMYCNNIDTVICKRFVPATVDGDFYEVFSSIVYNRAKLFVPKGSFSLYFSAPDWMKFLNIQELGEGGQLPLKGDVNGDGKVNVSDVTALVNIILGVIH